jgi:hypothetical protein
LWLVVALLCQCSGIAVACCGMLLALLWLKWRLALGWAPSGTLPRLLAKVKADVNPQRSAQPIRPIRSPRVPWPSRGCSKLRETDVQAFRPGRPPRRLLVFGRNKGTRIGRSVVVVTVLSPPFPCHRPSHFRSTTLYGSTPEPVCSWLRLNGRRSNRDFSAANLF